MSRRLGQAEKSSSPKFDARVLVAEDQIVNQKVARRILEKMGCRVDLAANGREAVEMVALLPYDVVFMDCQMPGMDGFQATAEIRKSHRQKIPIIAMTAHAMQGDREKCLNAGMDDYISKPVRPEAVAEALHRWLDEESQELGEVSQASMEGKAVLNPQMLDYLGGEDEESEQFIAEMLKEFIERVESGIHTLEAIIESGTSAELQEEGHALKGICSNVGAERVGEVCRLLESLGASGSLQGAEELMALLAVEFRLLQGELVAQ